MINTQQINTFVAMMKEKGYDGNFVNSENEVAGSLETLLGLDMMKNVQEHQDNKTTYCALFTITEGEGKASDFTACNFVIRYQPGDGFRVDVMSIDRYNNKGEVKSSIKLTVDPPKFLPKKERANTLAKIPIQVIRIRRQHGFSLN